MTTDFLKILKTIFIIVLYFLFDSLFVLLLNRLGIDYKTLSLNTKVYLIILCNLLLMLILYIIFHKSIKKEFKDFKSNFKKYLPFGLKWWIIGVLLMFTSNIIISYFVPTGASNEKIVQDAITKVPWYMLFSTAIYAPFVEEIIFRKNIKEMFSNNLLYILISGFLFGFVHILSANTRLELLYIIPYGVLGSVFAYIYTKTKNIFVPITFHMLHNFIIVSISIIQLL